MVKKDVKRAIRLTQKEYAEETQGGDTITIETMNWALKFIDLLPSNLSEPLVEPSGDGEILLQWDGATKNDPWLHVSVDAKGWMSYKGLIKDGKVAAVRHVDGKQTKSYFVGLLTEVCHVG